MASYLNKAKYYSRKIISVVLLEQWVRTMTNPNRNLGVIVLFPTL